MEVEKESPDQDAVVIDAASTLFRLRYNYSYNIWFIRNVTISTTSRRPSSLKTKNKGFNCLQGYTSGHPIIGFNSKLPAGSKLKVWAISAADGVMHPVKIVLPQYTLMIDEYINNTNEVNLDIFRFDRCPIGNYFDKTSRCTYLNISNVDNEILKHIVNVHLITMYTRWCLESREKQYECRIVFQLVIDINNIEIELSAPLISYIIKDKFYTKREDKP